MILRPDLYSHNNPDLAFVDSNSVRGGNRTVADLTALYALSSKSDQLKQYVTRVFVQSNSKWYTLIDINNIGSSLGWAVDQATNLQGVTDAGATTTNAITTAGLTITGGNGLVTTSQFYASASNITNSIFVGYDSFAVYLGYQMGSVPVHIGTGGSGAVILRNTGGFQIESLAGVGSRMMVVSSDGTVSTQSIPTNAVSSVFGRTGAVTAQSGDYTTAQVTESGNLYYTDARARAALSFSAGSGGYNSTTGVISIPTSSSNISEGSNLYFTEQRVRDSVLTGLNITGGSVVSTDSVLSAFGKIQNQINGLLGGSIFQSTWNASTNSPTLTSSVGTKGHYYIVATAGSTNLNGITDWQVGDWAIFDGSVWRKVDNTDAVVSVNGFTGAVSLTTSNISEGSNLYYTDARSRSAISIANGTAAYNSSTGVITIPSTTAHISESGNLFYTDARARAALSFAAGSGAYNSSTGVITIPTNTNQLTNGAGFITGINSSMVTTALGYTPYNSSNPAGYITSSALSSYLPLSGGTLTGGLIGTTGSFTTSSGSNYFIVNSPVGTDAGITFGAASTQKWYLYRGNDDRFEIYSVGKTGGAGAVMQITYAGATSFASSVSAASFSASGNISAATFNGSALGSYAYRSSGLAELSGATFTGGVTATSGEFINGGQDGSVGSVVRISTTSGNSGVRNWGIVNSWDNFGDLTFRVSNAQGGNALTAGTSVMALLRTGNVGIGTTSPLSLFHVSGSSASAIQAYIHNTNGATNSAAELVFGTWSGAIPTGSGNPGPSAKISAVNTNASNAATDLVFHTYASTGTSAERFRISSTGAATFSSTVASAGFTVGNGQYFRATRTSGNLVINLLGIESGTDRTLMTITGDYVIQNGAATPLITTTTSGATTFSSSVTATSFLESSDIRLKDVVKEMTSFTGIDTIIYNWKDRRDHLDHIGYSAQQVEEILPYAVSESNGFKTVDYNQVHTFKIMLLEDRILKLEDELKQYKNGL
jgi:hypothetical protein